MEKFPHHFKLIATSDKKKRSNLILWSECEGSNWRHKVSTQVWLFHPGKKDGFEKQTNVWNLSFLVIKCREATSNLREANQDKSGTKMPNTIILSPEIEQMETLKLPFQCMRSIFQTFQTIPGIVPCRCLFLRTHIDCFYLQTGGRSSTVIHHLMQTQSEIHWYLLTFNHSSWPPWMPGRALKMPGIPRDTSHRMPLKKW